MFEWLDWELLGRLEELVWRFFDRLANINWLAWSDEKVIVLALFVFVLFALLFWWLRWTLVVTVVLVMFVALGVMLAPAIEELQIPPWAWSLLGAILLLCGLWAFIGLEGRTVVRIWLMEHIAGPDVTNRAIRALGGKTEKESEQERDET